MPRSEVARASIGRIAPGFTGAGRAGLATRPARALQCGVPIAFLWCALGPQGSGIPPHSASMRPALFAATSTSHRGAEGDQEVLRDRAFAARRGRVLAAVP